MRMEKLETSILLLIKKSAIFLKTSFNELGKRRLGTTYNNIGLVYAMIDGWDKALEYYNKPKNSKPNMNYPIL